MKYIVKNENTLGYIVKLGGIQRSDGPTILEGWMGVLAGNIHGHNWKDGSCLFLPEEIRPATPEDFARFRVMLPPDFVN